MADRVEFGRLAVWTALPEGWYDADPLMTGPEGNAAAPEATPDESAESADAYPGSTLAEAVGSAMLDRLRSTVAFATAVGTALPDGRYTAEEETLVEAFAVAIGYALDQYELSVASVAFDVALADADGSTELTVELERGRVELERGREVLETGSVVLVRVVFERGSVVLVRVVLERGSVVLESVVVLEMTVELRRGRSKLVISVLLTARRT